MRKLSIFALTATTTLAQAHPQLGSVPGDDFATGTRNASFDYIVIGGGTAGLAIAYRLAESGVNNVAVVEAGGFYEQDAGNMSVVPAYSSYFGVADPGSEIYYPLVDWGIATQAQEGLGGRAVRYQQGKTFGGSSALNGMLYNRGTIGSYQRWADLVGDQSWGIENLLPYFSRGITFTEAANALRPANASVPPPANVLAFNSSADGPLQLSYPEQAQRFASYIGSAMAESGIPEQQDFVSGHLLGQQFALVMISHPAEERSTSRSYLDRARRSGRSNLTFYPHTLAKRIIFSGGNKTVQAVEVERGSYGNTKAFHLAASKEIALSAGAFRSPQLLMVSGVGPRKLLEAQNITVLVDSPGVGANMQDHLDLTTVWEISLETEMGAIADPTHYGPLKEEYRVNRTGPFSNPPVNYLAWEKLPPPYRDNLTATARADLAQFPPDWPEIEYEVTDAPPDGSTDPRKRYASIIAVPVSPLSRGYVNISSPSTRDNPVVNPNQLSHPTDRALAVQAFRRARSFFNTAALRPFAIREVSPGENVTSDEAILEYLQATAFQNWHASCSCRMGREDDKMAVVDSKARVKGVRGLRVVDASSFALLPPGHPQSTVYLMAEMIAADMLAADARVRKALCGVGRRLGSSFRPPVDEAYARDVRL